MKLTFSLPLIGSGCCFPQYLTSYRKKETRILFLWNRPIYVSAIVCFCLIGSDYRKTEGFIRSNFIYGRVIGANFSRTRNTCKGTESIDAVISTVVDKVSVFHYRKDTMMALGTGEASKTQTSRAPLYITVGPQCSGKTTVLAKILGRSNTDVSIDAQRGVYYPIPLQYALTVNPINMTETERAVTYQRVLPFSVVNQTIHGSTLQQRVLHPSQYEMHLVLQRLCGRISADDFRRALKDTSTTIPPPYTIPTLDLRKELIHSVEQTIRRTHPHQPFVANAVDLFVVEAIFAGGGLQSAQEQLHNLCLDETTIIHPVAWGNTNTRPREYAQALKAAEASGRPVYFIVYGHDRGDGLRSSRTTTTTTSTDHGIFQQPLFLPVVTRSTLLQRNIDRFCATGRYINVKSINDAIIRTEELITRANTTTTTTTTTTPSSLAPSFRNEDSSQDCSYNKSIDHNIIDATFSLHSSLANLAGFHLCPKTRTVSSVVKVDKVENIPRFTGGRYKEMNTTNTSFSNHHNHQSNKHSTTRNNNNPMRQQQSSKRYYRDDYSRSSTQTEKKRDSEGKAPRYNGSGMHSYESSDINKGKRQPSPQNNVTLGKSDENTYYSQP